MIFKNKKKPPVNQGGLTRQEALHCIPEKNDLVEETLSGTGDLILSYHAVYKPFFMTLKKLLQKDVKETFQRKIELDGLGKDVWALIDGKKNVRSIVKEFALFHKLDSKEAEISVTLFLRSLGEKGLVGIKENPGKQKKQ